MLRLITHEHLGNEETGGQGKALPQPRHTKLTNTNDLHD